MGLFGRRKDGDEAPAAESIHEDDWIVAEGKHGGRRLVLRFNEGAGAADRARWPVRVGIAVPCRDADADGEPGDADFGPPAAIEDALADLLKDDDRGVPTAVISTGGMREFVSYLWQERDSEALVTEARRAAPSYEVQSYVESDPDVERLRVFPPLIVPVEMSHD